MYDQFGVERGLQVKEDDFDIIVTNWAQNQDWPLLPTLGKHGFTLEVGPVPWGSGF